MSNNPKIRRLSSQQPDFDQQLNALLKRDVEIDATIESSVNSIITAIRQQGDKALFNYTQQFDDFDLLEHDIEISQDRLQQALSSVSQSQRKSLEFAAQRVRDFHEHQRQESWSYTEENGNLLGQKVTPLERVGLYVPGGKAAYPSSVLMNAIPAKVAGVQELIMVTPTPKGHLNEMVLAAACLAKVDKCYRIGGAQAVAALAYGTETIPAVDKIVGPGNIYVATAKKQVFGKVGIDMIAGPSEVLVIADDSVSSDWVAMDLFAQAEHDEMAQAILVTSDPQVADKVEQSIANLLPSMPRKDVINTSLQNNGAIILLENDDEIIRITDQIAPEHLEIFTDNADYLTQSITNAGAIFVGKYSAESLGDYCAGPNHVLPTSGTARFSSPLGVYDFQKRTSIIHCSEEGAQLLAENAATMATDESLSAHARSAQYRLK